MDPDKIKGNIHQPYKPYEEQEASDQIDPEKFKKVMKVEESEEAQKRKKRNLPREEEEGEDEPAVEIPLTPSGSFSEFMSDKNELSSVFDKQSGGIRRQAVPEEDLLTAPTEESISTEGVELDENSLPSQQTSSSPELASSKTLINSSSKSPTPPTPEEQQETPLSKQSEQNLSSKKKPSKTKKTDTSLLASQPKKSELAALKKKPKKSPPPKIKPTNQQNIIDKPSSLNLHDSPPPSSQDTPKETSPKHLKKEEDALPGDSEKQGSPFERFTPQQIRDQKIGKEGANSATYEGLVVPTSNGSEQGDMGEQRKNKEDEPFIEASSQTAGILLPTFEDPAPLMTSPTELPAYSTLSSEMHELFEKIGGVIIVQQDKGVTTTTVNIDMPHSVFDGAQVMLSQYSTAPNAYNIQLIGNPESVKIFSQNLDALKNSFEQANYNFKVHIQNPILSKTKKSPHLIQRKKSSGGKKEK